MEQKRLFNRWSWDVKVQDKGLERYIILNPIIYPHTFGRLKKEEKNIVERLINKLMRGGTGGKIGGKLIRTHGKLQGKKLKVINYVREAFEIIEKKTNQNPIQILVLAIENSAPREETTRLQMGRVSYQVSVDSSPVRRIDVALRNIALATIMRSFNKKISFAESLAEELILASQNKLESYAVRRKNEIERIAKSAR